MEIEWGKRFFLKWTKEEKKTRQGAAGIVIWFPDITSLGKSKEGPKRMGSGPGQDKKEASIVGKQTHLKRRRIADLMTCPTFWWDHFWYCEHLSRRKKAEGEKGMEFRESRITQRRDKWVERRLILWSFKSQLSSLKSQVIPSWLSNVRGKEKRRQLGANEIPSRSRMTLSFQLYCITLSSQLFSTWLRVGRRASSPFIGRRKRSPVDKIMMKHITWRTIVDLSFFLLLLLLF